MARGPERFACNVAKRRVARVARCLLDGRFMTVTKVIASIILLMAAPALARAEPNTDLEQRVRTADARLVPVIRDGQLVGIKVYAIKPGGRFAVAKFENGDTIERVNGAPVVDDAGSRALKDGVIDGKYQARVDIVRRGQHQELTVAPN